MRRQAFGIGAGLLLSAGVFAADDVAKVEPVVLDVPLEAYVGNIKPMSTYSPGLIFDNSTGAGTTNTANQAWAIDDFSLDPGNALPGSQLITGMSFAFAIRGTTGQTRSFDVLVEFLDTYNAAAPAGSPGWTGTMGTVVRVQFANLGQNAAYTTAMLNLTGLPGGGILLNDRGFAIDLKFVEPGTNDLIVAPNVPVTHFYTSNFTADGTNQLLNGHNSFTNWRDAGGTIGVIEASDARNFAWPTHARFYMKLQGNAKCPADFNGDGQSDFFDYLDFVGAFDVGCP
jgi:hypothetical protein